MRALGYVNILALHPRVRKDKNGDKHHIPTVEHVCEFLEYGLSGHSRGHWGPLAASEHWPDEEHAHNGSTQLQNDWQAAILLWLDWFVRQLKDILEEEKTKDIMYVQVENVDFIHPHLQQSIPNFGIFT